MKITKTRQTIPQKREDGSNWTVLYHCKEMSVSQLLADMPADVSGWKEPWSLEDLLGSFYFTTASEVKDYAPGDLIYSWHIEKANESELLTLYMVMKNRGKAA
jgi:hypothetical protein